MAPDRDRALYRLYSRLYRLASELHTHRAGGCAARILWALPEPGRALPGDVAFLALEALWGELSGLAGADDYGVEARAYAAAICSLLGGQEACWSLARQSKPYSIYLRECRGLGGPPTREQARALQEALEEALAD